MKLLGQSLPSRFRLGALAVLTVASCAPGTLFAQDLPLKPLDKSQQLSWDIAESTYVRREPKEAGAPNNDQPVTITPELLYRQLIKLQVVLPGGVEPLFGQDELRKLSDGISQALALAGPTEDLVMVSTAKREGAFRASSRTITARLFCQDGALQVILHDARLDFSTEYRANGVHGAFNFGSRDASSQVRIQGAGATRKRNDWLAVPMPLATAAPAPVAPAAVPVAAPAPAAVPAPVAAPARDTHDYTQQELRLRALQHLHDEKLVSDEEFQKKRTEIMNAF